MINCILVDDEPLAQEVIESYIRQSDQLKLIKKCNNALEAFNLLHTEKIDLIFLDIKMPSISGIEFVKSLKNPPAIIFTTAFSEFAVEGFELEAVDYLLKPITLDRFNRSIQKLLKIYLAEKPQQKDYTYFKVSGKLVKIAHKDLRYAQSVKDYILISTLQGNYLTHMTMKYLNELLPADQFIRVHRSYLVNHSYITLVDKTQLFLANDIIPVGENYRSALASIN